MNITEMKNLIDIGMSDDHIMKMKFEGLKSRKVFSDIFLNGRSSEHFPQELNCVYCLRYFTNCAVKCAGCPVFKTDRKCDEDDSHWMALTEAVARGNYNVYCKQCDWFIELCKKDPIATICSEFNKKHYETCTVDTSTINDAKYIVIRLPNANNDWTLAAWQTAEEILARLSKIEHSCAYVDHTRSKHLDHSEYIYIHYDGRIL
jgi:hypothetical protein